MASPLAAQEMSPVEGAVQIELFEALERVQTHNEDWEIARLQIDRSRAARREALAALLPQLSVSGSVTRNLGDEVAIEGRVIRQQYDWGVSALASVTLFDGPRYPQLAQADSMIELAEAETRWRHHILTLEAEQAFYTLAATQREVEIAQVAVELRDAYLQQAQALLEAGMAISLDVARARTQVLEARQVLLEAEAARGNASDSLSVLLGYEPTTRLRAQLAEFEELEAPTDAVLTELPERDDFIAQQRLIDASYHARRAIWWGILPRVDFRLTGTQGPASLFNPEGRNVAATVAFSWLLYDGGARYARMDAAQAQILERELALDRNVRMASAEMTRALREWQTAVEAIDVAQDQIETAMEAYEITRARFDSGLATSLEVTDASQALFRAELGLNQVRLRARLAESRYRYLDGTQSLENR
ncbi:MAG: TolC family protein [Bradymonadaceae bacterium]